MTRSCKDCMHHCGWGNEMTCGLHKKELGMLTWDELVQQMEQCEDFDDADTYYARTENY